jgi:hypothetical protein
MRLRNAIGGVLAACALSMLAATAADAGVPRGLPGADLAPIKGMAYHPTPSDYRPPCPDKARCPVYYGSDFFNADFAQLWDDANGGRGDLKTMASELGVNFLHLYDWDPARDHLPALNEALRHGIRVAVPISDYFVFAAPDARQQIERILRQVYVDRQGKASKTPHPAVKMLLIANEPENKPNWQTFVGQAHANVIAAEKAIGVRTVLPISVPFSFSIYKGPNASNEHSLPATGQVNSLRAQLRRQAGVPDDFLRERFVAATNPQNPGSDMKNFIPKFKREVPNTLWWFSEQGTGVALSCAGYRDCTPSEKQQALFNADQFAATKPGTADIVLGGAQFEWVNEPSKAGDNEPTFGITKYTGSDFRLARNRDGAYRVDTLIRKPSWNAVFTAFTGGKVRTEARRRARR